MKPGVRRSSLTSLLSSVFFLIGWHLLATYRLFDNPVIAHISYLL